jgi:hypothetical protein
MWQLQNKLQNKVEMFTGRLFARMVAILRRRRKFRRPWKSQAVVFPTAMPVSEMIDRGHGDILLEACHRLPTGDPSGWCHSGFHIPWKMNLN